jgi:hypothetical protein
VGRPKSYASDKARLNGHRRGSRVGEEGLRCRDAIPDFRAVYNGGAPTLCWDHAGLNHGEIAALFRLTSGNSAAQTVRRTTAHDAQTLKVSDEWEDKNVLNPFTALTPWELCDGLKIAVLAIYVLWSSYDQNPSPVPMAHTLGPK